MKREMLKYLREYHMLEPGDGVVVGLSGGADSVCLLYLLWCLKKELQISLRAVHVHHGLRGAEADRDEAFSRTLCEGLGVVFRRVKIDAAAEAAERRISVEEAGRLARYRIFEQEAEAWQQEGLTGQVHIATAHHAGDNAETILHNLFRGSGLTGLGGIAPVRGRTIRPLLWADRSQILQFLADNGQGFVEDSTNRHNDYTRNRIRNELLPLITKEINTGAVGNILRAGERIGQADRYFEKKAAEWLLEQGEMPWIDVCALEKEEEIVRGYIVRRMLKQLGSPLRDITARHIEEVLALTGKENGRRVMLPQGIQVRREYGRLLFEPSSPRRDSRCGSEALADQLHFQVFSAKNHQEIPQNQYTKWFDYDKIKDTLSVRYRKTGDYITLAGGGRKTVKAFMIDEKIPREARDQILLLADGSHILWIVGHRISEYYKITDDTKIILQVQADGGIDGG